MKKTLFLLWAGMLCWTGAQAEIINHAYDGSKNAEQNGDALETTISGAKSGDSIKVQAGTYQGNFTFEAGVNVSGGWNSTFTEQTDYATILDANRNGRPVSSTTNLPKLTVWSNLTLQNGKPGDGGGGAHLRANARLDHCLIQNNTTGGSNQAGGGVQLYNGGQLYNCIVRNDTATGDCGGVRINGAAGKVINCLIYGNEANNKCGGLRAEVGSDIIGNTIVGNNQKTDTDGNNSHCGLSLTMSENISDGSLLANNIIWGNKHKGNVSSAQIYYISRYPAANRANNAVYNQNTGTGSINLLAEDPGFVDAEHGDYRLIATSQLVDAGDDDSMIDTKDLLGNPRKAGSHVDIGANEFAKVLDGDDLQEFIDATVAGTTVYIQAGTFTGNFTMREGVKVSGGWNSTFNAQTGETILDADHSGRPLTQDADFTTETTWSNFTLTNGSMDGDGGGAYLQANGVLMNCKIISNTATNAGGVCMHGKGKLANCLVVNNTATNLCGGVRVEVGSDIIGNTIAFNNQENSSNGAITHCGVSCFTSNQFTEGYLANNVIWGNKNQGSVQVENTGGSQIYYHGRYPDANKWNNAIYNIPFSANNNINLTADPFVDAANGNYHLKAASGLIGRGSDDYAQGDYDLDGNPRKQGTVDMGCYERELYTRSVTSGNWGTICLPYAVAENEISGAKVYKVKSFATAEEKGLLLDEVDAMEAGKPYFFEANADAIHCAYIAEGEPADAGNANGLYGNISPTSISGEGNYVLQYNELHQTYNSATGAEITVNLPANRAHLKISEVPGFDAGATPSPRRKVLGIHREKDTATGVDNSQFTMHNAQCTKVLRNGQLFIERDGNTYNAMGQLVK